MVLIRTIFIRFVFLRFYYKTEFHMKNPYNVLRIFTLVFLMYIHFRAMYIGQHCLLCINLVLWLFLALKLFEKTLNYKLSIMKRILLWEKSCISLTRMLIYSIFNFTSQSFLICIFSNSSLLNMERIEEIIAQKL